MQTLPLYELRIKEENEQRYIWAPVRKRWLFWTPEEFVRQTLIHFLSEDLGYPMGLFSTEKGLDYHGMAKRYDLVVYDRNGKPLIAAECKRPTVALGKDAALQLSVYNKKVGAPHLLLTNGKQLIFFSRNEAGSFAKVPEVPSFESIAGE